MLWTHWDFGWPKNRGLNFLDTGNGAALLPEKAEDCSTHDVESDARTSEICKDSLSKKKGAENDSRFPALLIGSSRTAASSFTLTAYATETFSAQGPFGPLPSVNVTFCPS